MDKPYFIMIWGQTKGAFPIVDENENVAFFESEEAARKLADDHPTCQALGYEVFSMYEGL